MNIANLLANVLDVERKVPVRGCALELNSPKSKARDCQAKAKWGMVHGGASELTTNPRPFWDYLCGERPSAKALPFRDWL